MYGKLSNYAHTMCKNSNGTVHGEPRIINESKANSYITGYAKVNTMATTAFSRTKVHKGYFYCQREQISDGDVILDRADDVRYLVMSVKGERGASDETVYVDGTLYKCDTTLKISRFGQDPGRDAFGRATVASATDVAQDITKVKTKDDDALTVYALTVPKNFDVTTQQDREIPHNKISLCVQSRVDVKKADRLEDTDTGETYRVVSIDYKSLSGLKLIYVDTDER